jgi:hypothetical protein
VGHSEIRNHRRHRLAMLFGEGKRIDAFLAAIRGRNDMAVRL